MTTAVSAGSAGSVAALITTPVDVVKTRISDTGETSEGQTKKQVEKSRSQEQSLQEFASKKGVTQKGSLTVVREVMAESGIKGLFKGGALRAAWTALGSGLYLGVYESGRVFLGNRHQSQD